MTLKFNRDRAVVKKHVGAKFHQANCSSSWVILRTEKNDADENNTVRCYLADSKHKSTANKRRTSTLLTVQATVCWYADNDEKLTTANYTVVLTDSCLSYCGAAQQITHLLI